MDNQQEIPPPRHLNLIYRGSKFSDLYDSGSGRAIAD